MTSKQIGTFGEDFAVTKLLKGGYKIIFRNYHCRMGEVDIIAQKGKVIAFVEVKTRSENYIVSPLEAVSPSKRRKIILTAQHYLMQNEIDLQPRFDVFEVVIQAKSDEPKALRYDHYEGAFDSYGNV